MAKLIGTAPNQVPVNADLGDLAYQNAGAIAGPVVVGSNLQVSGTVTATTFSGSGASLTNIPNSATTATNVNTASSIVARDASGNFSAGTITASLTGTASGNLPLAGGTMTGPISFAAGQTWPTFNQNTTGSAATLATGRTIGMTGDVTWTSGSFNGSANVTGTATLANSGVTAGTYTKVTVDAKGRATSGTTLSASDIPNLDASKITSGVLDAARLPSYVDDVLEYANLAAFPVTGETGKIYVALDTNKTYRWGGSSYVYITSGAVDSVAGKTGVVTLTNSDVGLGNVENKSSATIRGELTSSNVTGALGFTPYNASNPSGFISGITSGMVTTALGYTPLNKAGDMISGAITSSLAPASINTTTPGLANYGFVFNGASSTDYAQGITWTWSNGGSAQAGIYVQSSGAYGTKMYLATTDSFATGAKTAVSIDHTGAVNIVRGALTQAGNQVLHAGNYSSYLNNTYMRSIGYASSSNDWNSLGNTYPNTVEQVDPSNFSSTANGPTAASYTYGTLLNFSSQSSSQAQIYISHAGNDLIFRGGWNGSSWQTWNKVLTNQNYTSYAVSQSEVAQSGASKVLRTGSNGYLFIDNWVRVDGGGMYSGTNSAHFYPNTGSYGAWQINGTRDGWRGLNFDNSVVLMMNDNESGHHKNGYGWQFRWYNGTIYNYKASNGGGTEAIVLDASNYTNYAASASHSHNYIPINPDGDGASWTYSDENPTINGFYIGGGQRFGADGSSYEGFLQAKIVNAYNGFVNSANGYYVGNYDFGANSNTYSTTRVIDGSGNFIGGKFIALYANPGDTVSGAPWYGLGAAPGLFSGSDVVHLAGYYGLRLRTASAYLDLYQGSAYYTSTFNAVTLQNNGNQVLHAGNYGSYALPIGGGTLTNSTKIKAGHGSTRFQLHYNHDDADTTSGYAGYLTLWASEPGISYAYTGIGGNINLGGQHYGRATSGQSYGLYLRFETASGFSEFWSTTGAVGVAGGQGSRVAYIDSSGNGNFSGNVTAYSDERLKKEWQPLAADFVKQLAKVKSGTYTRTDTGVRQAGSSAQDWQNLLPEVVLTSNDEAKTLALAYGNAALVSAIELAKDNVELRARIERLESLIEQLLNKE